MIYLLLFFSSFSLVIIMADVKETLVDSDTGSCDVETTNTDSEEPVKTLSKSQLKKIKRKERWEQVKGEKR